MPNPQEIADFARTLSEAGLEDLQLQLLSRKANKRKELLQILDELLEMHANAEVATLISSARVIDVSKPGLLTAGSPAKRSRRAGGAR